MAIASKRLTFPAVAVVVLTLIATPAFAAHTSDHATEQIWAVVAQAEQDMDEVVSTYATEIAGLQSLAEVELAEAAAEDAVVAIWSDARKAIEDLVKLYPGQLGSVGGQAKQQLLQDRTDALAKISELTAAWVPAVTTTSTTTTTTPTTTTTTTTPATTTTTTPTTGSSTSTTSTTTTTIGGSGVIPPPPGGDGGDNSPPTNTNDPGLSSAGQVEAPVVAQTPDQAPSYDTAQLSENMGASGTEVTEHMSTMLQTVLPPAVVELVLSPLLILEILFRTSLAGGQGIFVPLLLLAVCAVLISLTDRFSRRAARVAEPIPHSAV